MSAPYFAYGSNLLGSRLRARIPAARPLGRARLDGIRLVFDKPGRDGSAKANLAVDPAGCVWGALFGLPETEWPRLDRIEAGYERVPVEVEWEGRRLAAWTYRSPLRSARPGLDPAYKRCLVEGAREQSLPPEWVARLEELPVRAQALEARSSCAP